MKPTSPVKIPYNSTKPGQEWRAKFQMASRVELSDTRHITGRGETLNTVKFPKFHIFDANWALKLAIDDETHRISLKLSHKRRNSDDQWEMTGLVGFRVEINGKPAILMDNLEKPIDCRFSHVKNRLTIENFGVLNGNGKDGRAEVKVQIFMQVSTKFMFFFEGILKIKKI